MKCKFNICGLVCGVMFGLASNTVGQGIHFDKTSSWEQIKARAQETGKYIFVDCYASWCVPCKKMDREIYPQEEVGGYFNDHFISVKVQMDSGKQDDEWVRSRYQDASTIDHQYHVTAYPTFLFFSPKGELVHRDVGYRDADDFVKLAKDAIDPKRQFYRFLERYRNGEKDYAVMSEMAETAKNLGKHHLADSLANDYINHYLPQLKIKQLYTRQNIGFISEFEMNSQNRYFKLFLRHGNRIDKVMDDKGYAERQVDHIIYNEEIYPYLVKDTGNNTGPDWNKIRATIKRKYNAGCASRVILLGQTLHSRNKGNWPEYIRYAPMLVEKYGQNMDADDLNHYAFEMFALSDDTVVLKKALSWSLRAIYKMSSATPVDTFSLSNFIDTRANILYRLGRKAEAIGVEEQAVELAMDINDRLLLKTFPKNLAKMKNGEPTW